MNKCIFIGNFTKDTEYSQKDDNKVARNSIAINRGKDREGNDLGADFASLVAFGNRADFMNRFCTKGRKMAVECHFHSGSYEKDGTKIYTNDFVVDSFEFVDSKPAQTQDAPVVNGDNDFMNIPEGLETELPFA